MSEWEVVPLPEVLDFQEGPGIMARDFRDGGVPLIRLAGLKQGASLLAGCNYLDPEMVAKRWSHFRLQQGDVLLSTSASLGEVATVSTDGVSAIAYTGIIRFRPIENRMIAGFIPIALRSPQFAAQIEAMGVGSVMRHFGPSHLKRMTVPLPPPEVQEAIAELLGALDDKIAVNDRIAATVDQYCAAVFEEVVAKESNGTTELGKVAIVNAKSVKPTPGGSLRYVDIASVSDGRLTWPECTSWDDAPGRARREIAAGDTLWSTVRPNRRSRFLVLDEDPLLVASTGFAVITPRDVGPAFLYESARREEFVAYLGSVAEGSAYPAVRAEKFLTAPIPNASDEHRDRFEALAFPVRLRAHSAAQESRLLAELRDALLPELMTGRLRVKEAEKVVEEAA